MWTPFRADPLDLLGRRTLSQAVCLADGVLDPEIELGKHVWPAEPEDEEHLRGPTADSFHLDQMRDEIVVGHVFDGVERKLAAHHL